MSASVTVTPTESDTLHIVGTWLQSVLPSGVTVTKAYDNSVPMPTGDFVMMTALTRKRLATNGESYPWDAQSLSGDRIATESLEAVIQVDVFGPNAADNAQIVQGLWRDRNAVTFFTDASFAGAPLYASDPRQLSFVNGQENYENRWSIDLHMQVNATITTTQDFATALDVNLVEVDAKYPPA